MTPAPRDPGKPERGQPPWQFALWCVAFLAIIGLSILIDAIC